MEFEGQYLTYNEYIELGGSQLEQMPFNILEFEARKQIDLRTFNRLKDLQEIPQEVKMCVNKLINTLQNYTVSTNDVVGNGNVASESTDGYSVSYITADKIGEMAKSKRVEIDDIVRTYLAYVIVNGEHILYCGV